MTTSSQIKETLKFYSIRDMDEYDGTTGFMWVDCDDRSSEVFQDYDCLLYTSPSPRDRTRSRMPSSA